jgi:hypothetical protein
MGLVQSLQNITVYISILALYISILAAIIEGFVSLLACVGKTRDYRGTNTSQN